MVLVGDQDGHQRFRLQQFPLHMAGTGEDALLYPAAAAGCRQVVRHGFLRGFYHIGLGFGAAGGGRRMNPPVIQHLRDMQRCGVGVFRLHGVDQSQEQIMILCAVTLRALPADGIKQTFAEHGQVADVVAGHQVFRRIVRLKVGHMGGFGAFAEKGFIAVGEIGPRFLQFFAHAVDSVRGQDVIMVCQSQIFPLCQPGRRVGVGRNALVFNFHIANARVGRHVLLHQLPHIGVGIVRSIRQAELPVVGGLVFHTIEKFC